MAIDRDLAPCDVCRTQPARVLWSDIALCLACLAQLDRLIEEPEACWCLNCLCYAYAHHEEVG
jgi:hypothetical protein